MPFYFLVGFDGGILCLKNCKCIGKEKNISISSSITPGPNKINFGNKSTLKKEQRRH